MKRKMEKEMNMKREKETEKEMKKKMESKLVKKVEKETEKEMELCIIETKLSLMNTQTVAVLVSDCYTHSILLYLFI